jgi:hypothetical protein
MSAELEDIHKLFEYLEELNLEILNKSKICNNKSKRPRSYG